MKEEKSRKNRRRRCTSFFFFVWSGIDVEYRRLDFFFPSLFFSLKRERGREVSEKKIGIHLPNGLRSPLPRALHVPCLDCASPSFFEIFLDLSKGCPIVATRAKGIRSQKEREREKERRGKKGQGYKRWRIDFSVPSLARAA